MKDVKLYKKEADCKLSRTVFQYSGSMHLLWHGKNCADNKEAIKASTIKNMQGKALTPFPATTRA